MRSHGGTSGHFWQDDRGFIAVLAALLIVPLMTIIALAIDFANAADARSMLNGAAEAAAITAVTNASRAVALDPHATFEAAEAAGFARFTEKARGAGPITLDPIHITIVRQGNSLVGTASFSGTYKTGLSSLVGLSRVPVIGVSSSSLAMEPVADIQVPWTSERRGEVRSITNFAVP